MPIKTHKRTKSSRMHGRKMGTHGGGARKKRKGSEHRGGKGMSGSGKRADHKKTLITKLYGHNYFGKQGVTSRKTARDTRQRINLHQIEMNLEKYGHQGRTPKDFDKKSLQGAKKVGEAWIINLKKYKILGTGDVKNKLIITAKEASASAIEKVKAKGGEIILLARKKIKKIGEDSKNLGEGAKEKEGVVEGKKK
ncbi:MAG: uL15 family ribosomal protein [Nanoarchaeota archaeon]|nr:uL15 family ribosomal protein [Nanoarchaeota archaeon]